MTQQMRRSQFVITYGPGAILEGASGPKVIPSPDIGLFRSGSSIQPETYEISDLRMSEGLLHRARIFHLPSNAELNLPESTPLYRTRNFPEWALCTRHWILHRGWHECPRCGPTMVDSRPRAVRFIRACPNGHMDDVDWHYLIHRDVSCPQRAYYVWHGAGGSLGQVQIECPRCHRSVNFGWAYGQDWPCSGRYPERESLGSAPVRPGGCPQQSRIIQRQATNLRMPELHTLFTIPQRHTKLHILLQSVPVRSALVASRRVSSHKQLTNMLGNLVSSGLIPERTAAEILNHPWSEIRQSIADIFSPVSTSYDQLLLEEFHALIEGSISGVPPVHLPVPTSPVVFEIVPGNVWRFATSNGRHFKVVPISRLRTVTVQTGYRRMDPATGQLTSVSFRDEGGQEWLPGSMHFGEGVFIMLDEEDGWHFPMGGSAKQWETSLYQAEYPDFLFRGATQEERHPIFVWWHTLSHLLLRSIAVNSGYSSASIRERVYLEINNSQARGGIVLYTSQAGADGTLGGLIAMVPHFDQVLNSAFRQLEVCSNDPLCCDNEFRSGNYNGSACYGCVLVSETSCEHRNMWLDRRVVLDNMP